MWTNEAETPGNGVDDDGNGYVDDYLGWDFADSQNDPSDSGYHGTRLETMALMPDWWELENFGKLTGVDPAADPDHDGASNLAEWLTGTNPLNAGSCLKLTVATTVNGFTVSWPSASGRYYRLERSASLGGFSALRTSIPATAPANTEVVSQVSDGAPWFYRVMVEP